MPEAEYSEYEAEGYRVRSRGVPSLTLEYVLRERYGRALVVPLLPLSLHCIREGDGATLAVAGEIDLATVGELEEQLNALTGDGCRYVVVDFSEVEFCDCRGLSALVAGDQRIRELHPGGWLRLAGPKPIVSKLLRLTDLTGLLGVYSTVAEAQAAD